jgi:hypothetical protein
VKQPRLPAIYSRGQPVDNADFTKVVTFDVQNYCQAIEISGRAWFKGEVTFAGHGWWGMGGPG